MIDRTPSPRDERPPIPAFEPVPRLKPRHDGWTPERQVAFIEALADTGSVEHAARAVNMSTEGAYALRRHPDAGGFRRAWEAALDMGVRRLKDVAIERALHGELVPIIAGGKLLGYRRKTNDRLLTFVLRHYGQDAQGRTVSADMIRPARARRRRSAAREIEAAATISLPAPDQVLGDFAGVELDADSQARIVDILRSCAARNRAMTAADDPAEPFVREYDMDRDHPAAIEPPQPCTPCPDPFIEGESSWDELDLPDRRAETAAIVARIEAKKASGKWDRDREEERRAQEEKDKCRTRMQAFDRSGRPVSEFGQWLKENGEK